MLRTAFLTILAVTAMGTLLSACNRGCPTCYEDEWSREPFPGQPKQHIPPLEPSQVHD